MPNQLINFREERDFSQKINATFFFIRQNFKTLFTCYLYFVVPFAFLAGIFTGIYESRRLPAKPGEVRYRTWGEYDFFNSISSFNYLLGVFFSFISFIVISLTIYVFMVQYMDKGGKVTVREVWAGVREHFLSVFATAFGMLLLCMLGYVILLIPGIYVSIVLSFFVIVMVREELSFVETVERCFYLVKGYWWSTFGLLLMVGMMQAMMSLVLSFPVILLYVLKAFQVPGSDSGLLLIVANSFSTITTVLFYTISLVALAFQYFNLVEIKDGTGLLEQVALIGQPPAFGRIEEHA